MQTHNRQNSHPCQTICIAWDQTSCREGPQPGLACQHIQTPLKSPCKHFLPRAKGKWYRAVHWLLIFQRHPHKLLWPSLLTPHKPMVKSVKGIGPFLLAEKTDTEQHTYPNPSLSLPKYQWSQSFSRNTSFASQGIAHWMIHNTVTALCVPGFQKQSLAAGMKLRIDEVFCL